MQQGDSTVLSLRPGGRGNSTSYRFVKAVTVTDANPLTFGSLNSDLPLLRSLGIGGAPSLSVITTGESRFEIQKRVRYARNQLIEFREIVQLHDEISWIKKEIEAELFGKGQNWIRGETDADNQPQNRYSEPDKHDWRGRSAQVPVYGDDRSWDKILENRDLGSRHDLLNSQFAVVQISAQQGRPAPALFRAEVPWSARRGTLSEKDRVLKTVKGESSS